ncbi:methyltransferase domain-containing protein [Sphingomonas crusticola]|uniref:methyltransferase domain-containing protein n=1 Tax=Sphingomonas crusticola TaxID=1697973 RepID=UPI000E249F3A|nr:methyltransferase domain-containing protein [Sphingomonas crusticola]
MVSLVRWGASGHKPPAVESPEIFNRRLRRLRRDRAAPDFGDYSFIRDAIVEGLLDRLDLVTRSFEHALDLGTADGGLARALRQRGMRVTASDAGAAFAGDGVQCDEDHLPFAAGEFDLIVSAGVLDTVNDLPGALIQCRRALKPDGLFLAGFAGAGSLPRLKRALLDADQAAGGAVPQRVHPLIDVRSAGDLLIRAGFALPVADGEPLDVGYANPLKLMADLRGMAATNLLAGQGAPALTRGRVAHLVQSFAAQADADGRVRERFELVFMTGWAPGPDQPQPARRGSGTTSLAEALRTASK